MSSITEPISDWYIEPVLRTDYVLSIAMCIQYALKKFIDSNPDGDYEDAVKYATAWLLSRGKGHLNPCVIESFVRMERDVFENSKYLLPC